MTNSSNDAPVVSFKTRLARRFILSLLKIRRTTGLLGSKTLDREEVVKRSSLRIKVAAYSSMARAVGSRRAWSRALLFRLKRQGCCKFQGRALLFKLKHRGCRRFQGILTKKKHMRRRRVTSCSIKDKNTNNEKKKEEEEEEEASGEPSQADVLRNLVPGGEGMDICNLLEETAHFIKCLASQVQVMESIADHLSK